MKKRIILIHGLSSKPEKKALEDAWVRVLKHNIGLEKPELKAQLEHDDIFEMVYWADAIPHHVPDTSDYVVALNQQIDLVLQEREQLQENFHVGLGEESLAFFKDRGLDLVKMLTGALQIQGHVLSQYLREIELYQSDQYIADKIRLPLENALKRAFDAGEEVAIVAHSMGSFITYDVLWRFSHRNTPDCLAYRNKRVQMLTTLGSPLAEKSIRDILFANYHRTEMHRQFPTNVNYWHNYACVGDVVTHAAEDFESLFFEPMQKAGILNNEGKERLINYQRLHNPFLVVEHDGNKNKVKQNPHKSYGYLAQPRLGSWLGDFLIGNLNNDATLASRLDSENAPLLHHPVA